MSSTLNLSPDLPVLGIQAGLFLANFFVVKKLMLDPYLALRAKREGMTSGSQDEAKVLLSKAKDMDLQVGERLKSSHKEASQTREKIKSDAMTLRASKLASAELAAKKEQETIHAAIVANLEEERAKKEKSVDEISKELVRMATN